MNLRIYFLIFFFVMLSPSQVCIYFSVSLPLVLSFLLHEIKYGFRWKQLSQPLGIQPFISALSRSMLVLTGQNAPLFHVKCSHKYPGAFSSAWEEFPVTSSRLFNTNSFYFPSSAFSLQKRHGQFLYCVQYPA